MNPAGTTGAPSNVLANASTLPPPQFFVDHKKGEVNELKQLLRAVSLDKDVNKRRDVIKKVIAYMTLGIDVSRLYPEMVKASRTDDVVMKKMIYLYLINYAEQNQELVILAINTFLMDCKQQNHKIRGLALRSLCSLRSDEVSQYLQTAIQDGLNDVDPYVKKTAIIGCIKFYHMNKKDFKKTDFLDTLYKLTKDHDALVVINAIQAINEIRANKGGIDIQRPLVIHLLNRIKDFNEWGQSIILDLTAKYNPATKEEMFDIMNLLEDRFKHASSSVVLGAVKVFLHLTKDDEILSKQVFERLQAPLITLMTSSETTESYEVSFNVLSHIHLLVVKGASAVFESEYKHFFIKYDEPSYIKNLKLEILAYVASPNNIQEIVNELSEYVTDVNAEIAKKSIKCFGTIIIRLSKMSKTVAAQLRNFLSLRISYVTTETVIVLKDVLRKYRNFIEDFTPFLSKIQLDQIIEVEGKCAYAWILGEFGEMIDESPYILEKMIEEQKEFNSVKLSSVLLTSTFKLFFKRAPEVQRILGQLLEQLIKSVNETDLKQRAVFYYRLLKTDVALAEKVVLGDQTKITEFYEDKNEELRERLFLEFNSLSVVYQKPSERFLKDNILRQAQAVEKKYYSKGRWAKAVRERTVNLPDDDEDGEIASKSKTTDQQQTLGSIDDLLGGFGDSSSSQANTTQQTFNSSMPIDLLGDLDNFGTGIQQNVMGAPAQANQNLGQNDLLSSTPAYSQGLVNAPKQPTVQYSLDGLDGDMFGFAKPAQNNSTVELSPQPDIDSERFQQLWMELPLAQQVTKPMRQDVVFHVADIEALLGQAKIFTMASGQIGNELKLFMYAQMLDRSGYFLLETIVNQQTKIMSSTLKSTRPDLAQPFVNTLAKGVDQKQKEKEEKFLKERLEQEREKQLKDQLELYEKEKDLQRGKKAIKNSGILEAYDQLLEDIMRNGLPKLKLNGDIFEYASFFISKVHKRKQKIEWEQRNRRLQEREKHRIKTSLASRRAHSAEESDDSYQSPKRGARSKSIKGGKSGKKGGTKSQRGDDSDDDYPVNGSKKGGARARSKSAKGGKPDPKDKGKKGGKPGKGGAKSQRGDSPLSTKSGKNGKATKGKKGAGPKSRRSESPVSTKGGSKAAKGKKGVKGAKGKYIDDDSEEDARGRTKSRGALKGGNNAKDDPKRAKSAKKVTIDPKDDRGKSKNNRDEDTKSNKGGKAGDAKGMNRSQSSGKILEKNATAAKGGKSGKQEEEKSRTRQQSASSNKKGAAGGKTLNTQLSQKDLGNSPDKKGKGGKIEEPIKGGQKGAQQQAQPQRQDLNKSVNKGKQEEIKSQIPPPKKRGV